MSETVTLVKLAALDQIRADTVAANVAAVTPIKVAAEAARDQAAASATQALGYLGSVMVLAAEDSTTATFGFGQLITVTEETAPYESVTITFPN